MSRKPSTLEAYRRVLRLIHKMEAVEGTRLPTQTELMDELKICAVTLDAAMKWLIEDGVLMRKRRVGTFVLRPYPQNPKRSIWRVGLVMPPITHSYFGAVLSHFLHKHLDAYGISDRTYQLSPHAINASEVWERRPSDFTGLKDDIDEGLLDGIATSTRLRNAGIPVCGVASWERAEFGVLIDYGAFLQDAVKALLGKGCRNLLCVLPHNPEDWCYFSQMEALQTVPTSLAAQGIGFRSEICPISAGSGFPLERRFLERLLSLAPSERPDGLIVQDDITGQALASMLATTNYRPFFAVQTNRQIPISFAIPSLPFSVDLDQIASRAAELLMAKLLDPSSEGKIVFARSQPMEEVSPALIGWESFRSVPISSLQSNSSPNL